VKLDWKRRDTMSVRAEHHGSPVKHRPRITFLPTTNLGWWGVGLAAAFLPFVFAATVVPRGAAVGFICGLAGGVTALMAITRHQERALTVFVSVGPLVIAVGFLLVEFISGSP
jgi:hypothetical protein